MVTYCPICTFPYEYCEFGGSPAKCKTTLQRTNPTLYQSLYAVETPEDITTLVDDVTKLKLEKALVKDLHKEEARAERERKRIEASRVRIRTAQRLGKKQVTLIAGLHHFGLDLKKTTKLLSSKFACSCTIQKSATNEDEIMVQGDVIEDAAEFLIDTYPDILNEDNVIEEPRKRK